MSASEPSALNMRMVKSASGTREQPMSTSPSAPMPVWGELHATAAAAGSATSLSRVSTYI